MSELLIVGGLPVTALIVNLIALEVPPPGAGLDTVTEAVPAVVMSLASIAAVTRVVETNVVTRLVPFHSTTELLMKFVPLTVSVKAAPPATAVVGFKLVSVGTGLGAGLMVNFKIAVPVPVELVALNVTFVTAAVVGVPEIIPLLVSTESPAGSAVALKEVGLLLAVIW